MAAQRRSPLSKNTNQRRNTKTGRRKMAPASFALPGKKKYRLDDPAHARAALSRVQAHGTPAEKKQVRQRVAAKFPSIGQRAGRRKKGRS